MPGTPVDIGTGTTLVLATSAYTAELLSVDWSGIERPSIPTSHMATAPAGAGDMANATFIPGDITDPGELSIEVHFNPENEPPIDGPAEVATVTWPLFSGDTVAAKWACSAFVTSLSIADPLEDKMVLSMVLKCSGNITLTGAT